MKIKLQTKLSILIFSLVASPLSADFTEATSDYSKATVERWTEDRTNEYVKMADNFACIIQKSKTDLLHNHSYRARISEVDCGLEDEEINASGVSNRTTLSDVILKSSRASNTSPQEGTFWFNAVSGVKFVNNTVIKRNAEQLPPYGEWTSAYYSASGPDGAVAYNSSTAPLKGYVKISELENSNVIIESHDTFVRGSENSTWSSKIQYFDTDFNSSQVLGYGHGTNRSGNDFSELLAAKTNATHMYRASFSTPTSTAASGSCYKRDQVWKSGHDYGVFKESDGSRLTVSGGFGFKYDESGTTYRGHISNWGVDFYENRTTAFSSLSPTKSVTARDGTAYTLNWAPGTLEKRTKVENEPFSSVTPVDGNIYGEFKNYVDFENYFATVIIRYNSSSNAFEAKYYKDDGTLISDPWSGSTSDTITSSDISSNPDMGWLWSDVKLEWVYWNGGTGITYYTNEDVSSNAELLNPTDGKEYTAFTAENNYAAGSNLPVNAALFNADSGDDWRYTERSDSAGQRYYFTSSTPPTGFLARTLYTDPTGNGPVAGETDDKAVMFNFSAYQYKNSAGDWKIKYVPFGSETSADLGSNKWPNKDIILKTVSTPIKKYRWRFGALGWDNSVIALKADGSIYNVEQPKILKYVHTETKDMNRGQTINYFADQTNNNNPVKSLCGVVSGNYECEVEPTDFVGTTYNLKYDGNWLDGLPDMQAKATVDAETYWMRLINPKAGTVVTETVDGTSTNYVLKPLGIGETYIPDTSSDALTSTSKCGNLIINNLTVADFGWTIADLPAAGLVTLSDKVWADQPTELLCTVDNGDASSCVIN